MLNWVGCEVLNGPEGRRLTVRAPAERLLPGLMAADGCIPDDGLQQASGVAPAHETNRFVGV